MIIESDPPLSRYSINEIQFQMLSSCAIPGLLPIEMADLNGCISLRYRLSGTRMLTECMRTANWSMADMMKAVCRVAEVLEECRLYLLDSCRIKLEDEFIFAGSDWQDLHFTYIPLCNPVLDKQDDLERLVIRWMMRVTDPDGGVMQNVYRLVTSKDFVPSSLRTFARQYLANVIAASDSPLYGSDGNRKRPGSQPAAGSVNLIYDRDESSGELPAKKGNSWGLFQPSPGDLHSVSQMLGDDSAPWLNVGGNSPKPEDDAEIAAPKMEIGRWRTIIVCTSLLVSAAAWRYFYFNEPGQQRLLFCMFIMLTAGAGLIYLWIGLPLWGNRNHAAGQRKLADVSGSWEDLSAEQEAERNGMPRFPVQSSPYMEPGTVIPSPEPAMTARNNSYASDTTWLSEPEDRTGLLTANDSMRPTDCYLVCENGDDGKRIALVGQSMVIGRSDEAAQHVDTASGISRAHLEILNISNRWKVKDLGSRNGSSLNDQPMAPYELYPLQPGDRLVLANSRYRFEQSSTSRITS
ncbi:hypothetical protein SD71_10915 [Cohnella kolymensis]|uniref:FHA domain-containing protein n=1 Tax=Cohnella kolymensis TaxID=1590652 RepID=A0ABR5A5Q1_9BACL|nr:DUF6382 domain-containing protein [Cohnella kolymensis]KIL35890.1 hypothetical protein SD71_10915 [Cohnella kolymensis]